MTLMQHIDAYVAGNAGGEVTISEAERTLWNSPGLSNAWRADYRAEGSGAAFKWYDMRAKQTLRATTNSPTVTANSYNSKPGLTFVNDLYGINDQDSQAFIPTTGPFSFMAIFKKSTGTGNINMIQGSASAGLQLTHNAGTGAIRVRHNGADAGNTAALSSATYGFSAPVCVLYSFDGTSKARLEINGVLVASNDAVATNPSTNILRIAGAGDWYDLWLWKSRYLHADESEETRLAVYPYATARYGI